jgi:membrane-bound lytic murein transglycosylase B
MGRFRVIDALMTLSFDYTRRASYYKKELAAYLAYCHREGLSVTTVRGSFAGAIGLGQFMPTSLFAYGKDGNGDGHVDIVECEADGAASVANFLLQHGWKRGEKPLYPAEANAEIFRATASGGIKAHTTVGALLKAGVRPKGGWTLPEGDAALLVDLPWILADDKKGVDYFVGTPSFSAILHYNRSYFYAAAVSMLADEIRSREIAIEKARRPAEEPAVQTSDAPKAVQS